MDLIILAIVNDDDDDDKYSGNIFTFYFLICI